MPWQVTGGPGHTRPGEGKGKHLAELLINDSKLEVIADNMFVKGDDEPGGLWRTRVVYAGSITEPAMLGQAPHTSLVRRDPTLSQALASKASAVCLKSAACRPAQG